VGSISKGRKISLLPFAKEGILKNHGKIVKYALDYEAQLINEG